MHLDKIINEYPASYCEMLESAYGKNMMSEGGTDAIERMFKDIELSQKKCLDIGFGLGGAAVYLASQHDAQITGLEINPRMVEEANKKIPKNLKSLLQYVIYENFPRLPFPDASFDLVFSKGVLVHLENKQETFNEMFRVLKSGGYLVIDDWLSPIDNVWSERVKIISEQENLSLFPTSQKKYHMIIQQAGFQNIQMENISKLYSQYNFQITERLQENNIMANFKEKFGEKMWHDSIKGYQYIAQAMQDEEIIVMNMRAKKPEYDG